MEGPRAPQEQELNEVVQFLDDHLKDGQDWSIAQEYPLAIHSGNLGNIRIIKENNKLISSAVIKHLLIKTPAGLFRVAAIGSVVTSPQHRNLGYSRKVLEDCLRLATEQGCDFALLWSHLHDFYNKLGFELSGNEVALHIDKPLLCQDLNLRFMESSKVSPEAIGKLYTQHTAGTIRTVPDIQKHLQIPNTRVYTAWDEKNQIQAYAVEGKGRDLNGYVHEWGGGVSKLLPLLNFIYKHRMGQPYTLIAPFHAQNLIRQLEQQGVPSHHGYLGMIKILHSDNLLHKIKRYARSMGMDDFVIEKRDGFYYLGTPGNLFRTDSERDLVKIIFGPLKASQIHQFDPETTKVMETLFPVLLWVWGWDSV